MGKNGSKLCYDCASKSHLFGGLQNFKVHNNHQPLQPAVQDEGLCKTMKNAGQDTFSLCGSIPNPKKIPSAIGTFEGLGYRV